MEKRWQRLGLPAESLAETLEAMRMALANPVPYDQRGGGDSSWRLAIADRTMITVLGFLEFRTPRDRLDDWRDRAREAPAMAAKYFFGTWRRNYEECEGEPALDAEQCRQRLAWIDPYLNGIVWALAFDDEANLKKLIQWPDSDLPPDDGVRDLTKEDCQFHTLLAKWLRGEPVTSARTLRGAIEKSNKRRPKLLLAVLDAIEAKDQVAVGAAIVEHLKHFQKSEAEPRPPHYGVSIDATILWHVARRHKLQPNLDDQRWLDLVVRP